MLRALGADGAAAPAENQGFLRRDALLAIIMLTNEDDCSARPGVALYDTRANITLSSQLGPPANFRCNEFGHLCDGVPPVRKAPGGSVTATVPLQNCVASECGGAVTPVAEFVARIKALKAAPASEIVMAAITGPVTPYVVGWKSPSTTDTGPWPVIAHSCTAADGSFADPGVRIAQAVSAFGANGLVSSLCEPSFGPALQQIAARIGTVLAAGGGTGPAPAPIPACPPDGGSADGAGGADGDAGSAWKRRRGRRDRRRQHAGRRRGRRDDQPLERRLSDGRRGGERLVAGGPDHGRAGAAGWAPAGTFFAALIRAAQPPPGASLILRRVVRVTARLDRT